jgi:protein MPE1
MANNLQDFAMQMDMMSRMSGMPGMPPGGMMNPMMMGMNPMMMGGPGAGGMNPMMNPMMGQMGMGGMNGMNGNMNGGFGFGPQGQQGFGGHNGGGPPAGPRAWQQQQNQHHQQQQWGMHNGQNGAPQGPAANGAYFRQPVNPGRAQNRGRGQRSLANDGGDEHRHGEIF